MTDFEVSCATRIGQLRAAFIELYESIGADPTRPQDVARKLKVNKTLTWNVAHLMQANDDLGAVAHVPGTSSLEKVIHASVKHGANPKAVALAREAVREFDAMIKDHAGDRPTLDLIIDGAGSESSSPLELSRKLAFRGNSGIYGVQARTRVVTNFLSPNPDDPTRLDMAHLSGYVDFRRLRGGVRWPIFVNRSWTTAGDPLLSPSMEPIEPSPEAAMGIPIIPSAMRGNPPTISSVDTPEGRDFVLGDGPIGNDGAFTCFCGDILRGGVRRYAIEKTSVGEFGAGITVPVEQLIMDIIVDRDLEFALKPELLVFGHIFAHGKPTGDLNDPSLLPIKQSITPLTGNPLLVNTPAIPNYASLIRLVYERMSWDPKRFSGVRLVLDYPPLGSHVLLRFRLPHAGR